MIRKLPPWVWIGGGMLSAVAGMLNAVGFLGLSHHGLTHMSGTASALGISLVETNGDQAGYHAALLGSFIVGAMVSGVLVRDQHLRLCRRHGVALLIEAALIGWSLYLLLQGRIGGTLPLAMAAGLQNALATSYSGAIVRTTHVTGIFTDIGIVLGGWLRGQRPDGRKLTLLGTLGGAFILGSAAGALQFEWFGYQALWTPLVLTSLGGSLYLALRLLGQFKQRR